MIGGLGRALRPLRADPDRSPLAAAAFDAPALVEVTSPSFSDGGPMPRRCAGRGVGDDVSPELHWTGVPDTAKHLLLLLDDVDVPLPKPLFHSAAVLEPTLTGLGEGGFRAGTPGLQIVPTLLAKHGYSGPRPIPGHGPHRYRFHLLALDADIPDVRSVKRVLAVASGSVLARGVLTGTYER